MGLAAPRGQLTPHATYTPHRRSRLGCQIKCTRDIDGLVVRIPSATRNMAVDGYVAKPH